MKILEFKLEIDKEKELEIIDYVCIHSLRGDLREKLKRLNIKGRTTYLNISYWYDNSGKNKEDRMKFYPSFLEKMPIEDWILWKCSHNLQSIDNLLHGFKIKNLKIVAMLNDTIEEQETVQSIQDTWV